MGPSILIVIEFKLSHPQWKYQARESRQFLWVMQFVSTRAQQHVHSGFLKGMHLVTMTWRIHDMENPKPQSRSLVGGCSLPCSVLQLVKSLVTETCSKVIQAMEPQRLRAYYGLSEDFPQSLFVHANLNGCWFVD